MNPKPASLFASQHSRERAHHALTLPIARLYPPIFVAVFFGSTAAVMTSFASALAAAYFIYPPQFSFLIYEPRHIAELAFILVLAITASKTVGVITSDKPLARRLPGRA